MEKDNEIKGGDGNSYDFGARMLDPRIGRWLTIDPMFAKYPSISPYSYCANSPIYFKDPDGRDLIPATSFKGTGMHSVLNGLVANNSKFNTYITKFKGKNSKFNITFTFDNTLIPAGADANADFSYNYNTVEGKKVFTAIQVTIAFREDLFYNEFGQAVLIMHEFLHAYAVTKWKVPKDGEEDKDHKQWGFFVSQMQEMVREYAKDHGIALDEGQIYEISIVNIGKGGKLYDDYINKKAKENGTTPTEEINLLNERMRALLYEKNESDGAGSEEDINENEPVVQPGENPFKKDGE